MYDEEDQGEGPYLIRPTLSDQEVWARNKRFKNWGKYWPVLFVEGQPRILLTAVPQVGCLSIALLLVLYRAATSPLAFLTVLFAVWFVIAILFTVLFLCTDPGISSNCLPVANQQLLRGDSKYCQPCKIYKTKGIRHCELCGVCVKDILGHTSIMERCITQANFWKWQGMVAGWIGIVAVGNWAIWFT